MKTKYQTGKTELEKKIPETSDFLKKTDLNAKIREIKNRIADISGLATKFALTVVENKIPDVSSLVKKTDYNTKVTELENKLTDHNHDKYITTPEFKKLIAEHFIARLKQTNLVTKTDFDDKLRSLNKKINSYKTKHLVVKNELKKSKSFDLGYFYMKKSF